MAPKMPLAAIWEECHGKQVFVAPAVLPPVLNGQHREQNVMLLPDDTIVLP